MPENLAEINRFALRRLRPAGFLAPMSLGRILRGWWPAVLWMLVIFWGSTDALSSQHTSRFIGPLLRWFNPDISHAAIHFVQLVVRKGGHLTEYAILAILFFRALRLTLQSVGRSTWPLFAGALVLAAVYAVSDEVHQATVASRYGSGWDVLIDSVGAMLGLGALRTWQVLRASRGVVVRDETVPDAVMQP